MKILGIIGPQEIIIILILIIIGLYVYFIIRASRNIKKIGGSNQSKILKWTFIILSIMVSVFLFSMNISGFINPLIIAANFGAIVGISKYKNTSKSLVKNQDNNNILKNV